MRNQIEPITTVLKTQEAIDGLLIERAKEKNHDKQAAIDCKIGLAYFFGHGEIEKNLEKAITYLKRSSSQGNLLATIYVSYHTNTIKELSHLPKIWTDLQALVKKKDIYASYLLGVWEAWHHQGSNKEAERLFLLSSEIESSHFYLGNFYKNTTDDYEKALIHFKKRALLHNPPL